jgi:uncharacterized protein
VEARLDVDRAALEAFCGRWDVAELSLFGSVLREDFGPTSDVDVLVTFAPDARPTLFDLAEMEEQLSELFGRPVDLVSRRGIESSRNPIRRDAILSSARVVHAAR